VDVKDKVAPAGGEPEGPPPPSGKGKSYLVPLKRKKDYFTIIHRGGGIHSSLSKKKKTFPVLETGIGEKKWLGSEISQRER